MAYLMFIPWILFFPLYSFVAYKEMYGTTKQKKNKFLWFRKNFYRAFRVDILLLMFVFIYFILHKNSTITVIRILFLFINLYLLVNTIYDIPTKKKQKINWLFIIQYIILMLLPIIFYIFTKNFNASCLIMFGYTFMAYIIVIIMKIINDKIGKDIRKTT